MGSIRRAGGLSPIQLGLQSTLAKDHAARTFWEPAWIRGTSLVLVGLGCLLLAIGWLHKREVYFAYFGWLCLGWAVVSTATWTQDLPWDNSATEFMLSSAWPLLLACAVQFFLSFAGLRSRVIENILAMQWVAMPLSLLAARHANLFRGRQPVVLPSSPLELAAIVVLYLITARRQRPQDVGPMVVGAIGASVLAFEFAEQWRADRSEPGVLDPDHRGAACCSDVGVRLFLMFARALHATEADRNRLAERAEGAGRAS